MALEVLNKVQFLTPYKYHIFSNFTGKNRKMGLNQSVTSFTLIQKKWGFKSIKKQIAYRDRGSKVNTFYPCQIFENVAGTLKK